MFIVAAVMAILTTSAMATTLQLYKISPVAGTTTTVTEGRGITPDGKYVVFSDGTGTTEGGMWDVKNGSRTMNAGGAVGHTVSGIAYRNYTTSTDLIAMGDSTGGTVGAVYFNSTDKGATWGPKLRRTNTANLPANANAVAASLDASDAWYNVRNQTGASWVEKGSGAAALPIFDSKSATSISMQGVSGHGVAVGGRNNPLQPYVMYFKTGGGTAGGLTFPKTLNAAGTGMLYAISGDSTKTDNLAGGYCEITGKTGKWPYVVRDFDADVSATGTATAMPVANPSATNALNGNVYGISQDGTYAVGMDYTFSGAGERAVLWTYDVGTDTWAELNLTQWASDHGLLDGFTALGRAYAVGVNAYGEPVITGTGGHTDGTRGFVLTVPEPATMGFLALGGLFLLRRRR